MRIHHGRFLFEEELAYCTLCGLDFPHNAERARTLLRTLVAMLGQKRLQLWGERAMLRLPAALIDNVIEAQMLAVGVARASGNKGVWARLPSSNRLNRFPWLESAGSLTAARPSYVRLVDGGIEFAPHQMPEAHEIAVTGEGAFSGELRWRENGTNESQIIRIDRNYEQFVEVKSDDVELSVSGGRIYRIKAGQPEDHDALLVEPATAMAGAKVRPLCLVLRPFGRKSDRGSKPINFDSVFDRIFRPAIEQAGLEAIPSEEEKIGSAIGKSMFERLMLFQYVLGDLTGGNPNVFYELGVRHALRPSTTAITFLEGTVLPFDPALVRGISYKTDAAGEPLEPEISAAALAAHLTAARLAPHDDSPLFQLVDVLPRWQIDHSKTDIFREQVDYCKKYKQRLSAAVRMGADAVKAIAAEPGFRNLNGFESGIVVDLYLSLRDVKAYAAMIELYERMPRALQKSKMIREQLGFALDREGRFEQAERVFKDAIAEFGPSSEINGLLGRLYKNRWGQAKERGAPEARGLLQRAIDTYAEGFEADWRDAYPGVNALILMEQQDNPDPRKAKMLPVVYYAVMRKAATNADYWDYATLLELAVLGDDRDAADENLAEVSVFARHVWELESTKRNLGVIRRVRQARNQETGWIEMIENELQGIANKLEPSATA